jgi:hypothetical protein
MKLSQKLLDIQKACNYFQKDKSGFGYKYTAGSTILAVVRAKMDELGVLCYPEIKDAKTTCFEAGKKDKGGSEVRQFFTEMTMNFVWRCTETDSQLVVPWYAQGFKDTEQGLGNALTYAERYFLLKFFKIPTDQDDPDAFFEKQDLPKTKEQIESEIELQKIKELDNQKQQVRKWVSTDTSGIMGYLIDQGLDPKVEENIPVIYNQLSSLKKQYMVPK